MPAPDRQKHRGKTAAVLAVICALMAVLLIAGSILLRVKLTVENDNLNQLQDRLEQAQEENARLRIEYEGLFDLGELEEYAKDVLGMQKPDEEQIIKIEVDADRN